LKRSDLYGLGLVVTLLVALGLVVLASASEQNAIKYHGDALFFLKRQFAYLVAGIGVAFAVARVDYRIWREHPWCTIVFAGLVFLSLWAVFAFPAVKGSHRWIVLGPIRVQPGEFAKLATVIAVAVWMECANWRVETFLRGTLLPGLIIGALACPVLLEPDFGSVMVIAAVGGLVMVVAGTKILYLTPLAACGLAVFVYKLVTNANRMRRLSGFLGENFVNWVLSVTGAAAQVESGASSVDRAAYQAQQSLIAIKNGGIFGVGLRQSMQKHYYLPEAHTDFIFAIGAEELGLFFSIGVIVLFALFLFFSVRIALRAEDRFGRHLVIGMTFIIFFQAMFNLGVVCEALPTKGMALPFFSYGGTNLLSAFFAVGTIVSVGLHTGRDEKRWRM